MGPSVEIAEYGRPAGVALAAAVADAKGDRALAPVTVIVASHFVGLAARRLLGSGVLTPGAERRGIANVSFLTPHRFAELVAPDQLLDRRPLTNPVLGAAVRMALRAEPGEYRAVAGHHATELAVADLYGELDTASHDAHHRLASEGGAAGMSAVRLYDSVAVRLDGFHSDSDIARVAAELPDLDERLEPFGPLIWYLPEPITAPLADILRRSFEVSEQPARIVVGTTGDDEADAPVWQAVEAVGGARPAASSDSPTAISANHIVSVTDPDEEVRAVVRQILTLAENGTRLDRIGVFFPAADPYVGILEQQLRAAAIAANGPSRHRLADSVAGRALVAALALPDDEWRRDRVMALVSAVPIRHPKVSVRPPTWERASRSAGVVKGLEDWRRKLAGAVEAKSRDQAEAAERPDADWLVERLEREIVDLRDLATFVADLDEAVANVVAATTWPAKSAAAIELLHHLLGAGGSHTGWPEDEQAMFEQVERSLIRLGGLDVIEPEASHVTFVAALMTELDVRRSRSGRFGEGLLYGPLASAVGHDLDAVFILGCAEGQLPSGRGEDALLPDRVRELANGDLELRSNRILHQHRHFLAALATAPDGRRTLTFPRGDLRAGRQALPSRWLLDTASRLAGRPIYSTDFEEFDGSEHIVKLVPSHAAGVRDAAVHASADERDLAAVARHQGLGGSARDHAATRQVARGLEMQDARRGKKLTEFDGNLAGEPIPKTSEKPQSPTRLQNWAACGFRYYLGSVLGLSDRDNPEQIIELSALHRGSAVHEALELFIGEAMETNTLPDPDEPWSSEQRDRLREIADGVFDGLEKRGLVGRQLHWRIERLNLLSLLADFLDADDDHRRSTGSTPVAVELPFGLAGAEPVGIKLSDGRELRFRGFADRVDRGADGTFHVSDYKTGQGKAYEPLKDPDADPTQEGSLLQLGLYAEAAKQLLGAEQTESHYWIVDSRAGHARYGYPWTPGREARLHEVLAAMVEGIEGGMFAAVPGELDSFRGTHKNCTYCDFDSVCPRGRGEQALEKAGAPEHHVRLPLTMSGEQIVEKLGGLGGPT